LIINKNSSLKSSENILNGGNCEVGEYDDSENDMDRDRIRSCKKFSPNFQYSGKCATNPLPTNIKILSLVNKQDTLNVNYSLENRPASTEVRWRFDQESVNFDISSNKNFLFPGRHLIESIVIDQTGHFRKIGTYQNISPNKFNKGQVAVFQFKGLRKKPSKVTALMDLRKFTLLKSEQNPEIYSGEIPVDSAGNKSISIPEFEYRGSFYLNILPAISNPNAYINSYIDSLISSFDRPDQIDLQGNLIVSSFTAVLNEIKVKISTLPVEDQNIIAIKLQANTENISNQVTQSGEINSRFNLLSLLIPTANAQAISFADRFIPPRMKEYTISDIISALMSLSCPYLSLFQLLHFFLIHNDV
jgi:hypothetical protein